MATKTSFVFILTIFSLYIVTATYQPEKVELPANMDEFKIFSSDDIADFDGSDPDKPIYMGVKGVVFDVSSGARFYGKDTSYNALAGKDCTRAVAKMSLDPEDLVPDISGLSEGVLKSLDSTYKQVYVEKYPIVGYMDYLVEEQTESKTNTEL